MDLLHNLLEPLYALKDWTVAWADSPYAVWALFGIAFAESSFFPIPPDALMIPMGFAASAAGNSAHALTLAAVTTAGSFLGGMFGFQIGRWGGRPLLHRFFDAAKINLVQGAYRRFDVWAVGLAGFTPIPYKIFSISAGAFDLDFKRFLLATILGRGGRFFLVGAFIAVFGPAVQDLVSQYMEVAAVAFAALLVAGFWVVGYAGRRATAGLAGETPPADA